MKKIIILVLFTFVVLVTFGRIPSPKYEFRAVWVATVANIDWPSQPGLSAEEQKQEIIDILDMHRELGMNVIILQVRPAADAIYPSFLEPWSRYLSGVPGKGPDPFYDPLKFWTEECHNRGMELHAWLNPFRVALNYRQTLAAHHIAFEHPEWVLKYGDGLYFDPGLPGTREFIAEVVKDIVTRYDVDAIHFDDYFYPYPLKSDFPDTTSFALHNRNYSLEDKAVWRRENVDIIIQMLNDTIKRIKPWVKFGISPFGVWRNRADDPSGSETKAGVTNYDHLYADIVKWSQNGWIDYCLPQLYWHIGHPLADFETLAYWWRGHGYGRGLYLGHGVYKSDAGSSVNQWRTSAELSRQIKLLRQIPGIGGSAFYSSKHFKRDLFGFQDSLALDLYAHPAIVPAMPWLDNQPPPPVKKLKKGWWRRIKWDLVTFEAGHEMDEPWQFVIYLNEAGTPFDPDNPEFIHAILGKEETKYQFSRINSDKKAYEVRISVLDRLKNESVLSDPVILKL